MSQGLTSSIARKWGFRISLDTSRFLVATIWLFAANSLLQFARLSELLPSITEFVEFPRAHASHLDVDRTWNTSLATPSLVLTPRNYMPVLSLLSPLVSALWRTVESIRMARLFCRFDCPAPDVGPANHAVSGHLAFVGWATLPITFGRQRCRQTDDSPSSRRNCLCRDGYGANSCDFSIS